MDRGTAANLYGPPSLVLAIAYYAISGANVPTALVVGVVLGATLADGYRWAVALRHADPADPGVT